MWKSNKIASYMHCSYVHDYSVRCSEAQQAYPKLCKSCEHLLEIEYVGSGTAAKISAYKYIAIAF